MALSTILPYICLKFANKTQPWKLYFYNKQKLVGMITEFINPQNIVHYQETIIKFLLKADVLNYRTTVTEKLLSDKLTFSSTEKGGTVKDTKDMDKKKTKKMSRLVSGYSMLIQKIVLTQENFLLQPLLQPMKLPAPSSLLLILSANYATIHK